MHYHCEVILPPDTEDIVAAVGSVMKPFNENDESEEADRGNAFWDFYVIGGMFAGNKQLAQYDQSKIEEFYQWLKDEEITVSSFHFGKQELSPSSQIPKVDGKWNEMFPKQGGVMVACPLFKHSNDQYGMGTRGTIEGDISRLGDSKMVKCSKVIFAGPSYDGETKGWDGPLRAVFMLTDSQWNGVNHMDVRWDGTIQDAFGQCSKLLDQYTDSYREKVEPNDDWLCVTVDYHC